MADPARTDDLEVRPPKQQRSREAWNRVLDAGVVGATETVASTVLRIVWIARGGV